MVIFFVIRPRLYDDLHSAAYEFLGSFSLHDFGFRGRTIQISGIVALRCIILGMIIWLILILMALLVGLLVNYLSDMFVAVRFLDMDQEEVGLEELACQTCLKLKPLTEYFGLPLTCAQCGNRRWRMLWVYLVLLLLSFGLWHSQTDILGYLVGMAWLSYFGIVVVIDMEHRLILHPVSLIGAGLGLAYGLWQHGLVWTLIGGAAGFGIMLGLFFLGALFAQGIAKIRGEDIDEIALGFGDVNLAGVLGLVLGWPGILGGLVLAILLGGVVSLLYILVTLILRRYRAFAAIPYGPFLVTSAIFLLFFRDALWAILP
jgi:leader peptidase (prepilin peptidase) / N-methyltransferase